MKLFDRPLSEYFTTVKSGVYLLVVIGSVRFLMLPVFGVPYEQGTTFTSTIILLLILGVFYSYRASQSAQTSYRDLLGFAFVLSLATQLVAVAGILIDDLGGIETYYTAPGHSLDSTLLHIVGHMTIPLLTFTLLLWGVGSLIKKVTGSKAGSATA